jgi:sugar phosphate isomerase/epimerase
MKANDNRRNFLKSLGLISASASLGPSFLLSCSGKSSSSDQDTTSLAEVKTTADRFFNISLAEWSLHNEINDGKMINMDFPARAKNDFGINAIEYVNQFFMDKAKDSAYLTELKQRCDDLGVASLLIMCDNEGALADKDAAKRKTAVENHFKWVEAAKFLGCHSIRVNSFGEGSAEEVAKNAIDGLSLLSEFAAPYNINVIVENHGGYSSDGKWLSGVMNAVGLPNCGTLPDFGNFCIRREEGDMWDSPCVEMYDRYQGVAELMPFAKGVSAKSYDFDEQGNCVETDYGKILKIVKDSGYTGYIGIEYEGSKMSEQEGILATKALLERAGVEV